MPRVQAMTAKGPSLKSDASVPVILCVGRVKRSEFHEVLPILEPWGRLVTSLDTSEALAVLAREASTPDVIVIVQSYPGEFTNSQIDALRRVAPLARLVAVLGTWCEGEMRTGSPWPGAVRVYWHQWPQQGRRELESLMAGRDSLWNLPPTTSEEERCLAVGIRRDCCESARPSPEFSSVAPLVEIVTEQFDVFDCLAAACRDRGYRFHWRRSRSDPHRDPPAAILFDAAGEADLELARFRQFRAGRSVPAVVLMDFPRIADRNRFLRAGASGVVSRPYFWEDLFCYFPGGMCEIVHQE